MAVDILETIFEVLRVENLASQYSAPLDQFLYTVFFPSIFIILLVYIIANRFVTFGEMWKILIGVAIYVFIIVFPPNETYSLYSMFAPLGQVWFILIIILVGIYAFFRTFFPGGGVGGAGGGAQSRSGLGSQITKAAWNKISGREKALVDTIKSQLDILDKMDPSAARDISDMVRAIKTDLNALYGMSEVGGVRVFKDHQKLLERLERIAKKKKTGI